MHAELSDALLDSVLKLGRMGACDRVLLVGLDGDAGERLKPIKKKLIFASPHGHVLERLGREGYDTVRLPGITSGRLDRMKAALVGAVGAGLIKTGEQVLCAVSREDGALLDTMMILTARDEEDEHSRLLITSIETDLPAQLFEIVVDLALRVGREGYEGRSVGTLLIVGDSTRVMEHSHPLTLNPFQGYSEAERNLFDPHVRDAVLAFAMLDGAFVVRDDGVVLAAGRHVHVTEAPTGVPLGFGARHVAAAAMSQQTRAIAVAVSQSSGAVRVFRNGVIVLEISPSGRRTPSAGEAVAGGSSSRPARHVLPKPPTKSAKGRHPARKPRERPQD